MKPPSLRKLTAELRDLHAAWSHPIAGGEYATLWHIQHDFGVEWRVGAIDPDDHCPSYGREWIPGDGAPFDAVAAARRILADLRDASKV